MFAVDQAEVFTISKNLFVSLWNNGVMTLAKGRSIDDYKISPIHTDWDGVAYRLDKSDNKSHYNLFCARNGQDNLCDCNGFEAHGHCKHMDAMLELLNRGLLEDLGRPKSDWPTPEQLAEAAGVPLPF